MSVSLADLLDTNILSDLVRNPQGAVAAQIAKAGEDTVCTSIIVATELRYGATKSNSAKLEEGTPIGPNDLLVAVHALANDLTVITANVREFSRAPGLKVENWLQT